jgi:hypothetical protein
VLGWLASMLLFSALTATLLIVDDGFRLPTDDQYAWTGWYGALFLGAYVTGVFALVALLVTSFVALLKPHPRRS